MTTMLRLGGAVLALALLAGCGEERPWNTKNVTGVMEPLEFELTRARDGETITEAAYDDRIKVLFFGFTNCPGPCPTTLGKYRAALNAMDEETADQVRFLFVSVDPQRDSLEKIEEFVEPFGDRFVGLRGEIPYLRKLTKRYRVTFSHGEPDADGSYDVSHSMAAFVFDRDERARLLTRTDERVADIQADLERLVAE